jgi:hypothetical protein
MVRLHVRHLRQDVVGIGGLLILGGLAFFAVVSHGVRLNLVFAPMLGVALIYWGAGGQERRNHGVRLFRIRSI